MFNQIFDGLKEGVGELLAVCLIVAGIVLLLPIWPFIWAAIMLYGLLFGKPSPHARTAARAQRLLSPDDPQPADYMPWAHHK